MRGDASATIVVIMLRRTARASSADSVSSVSGAVAERGRRRVSISAPWATNFCDEAGRVVRLSWVPKDPRQAEVYGIGPLGSPLLGSYSRPAAGDPRSPVYTRSRVRPRRPHGGGGPRRGAGSHPHLPPGAGRGARPGAGRPGQPGSADLRPVQR